MFAYAIEFLIEQDSCPIGATDEATPSPRVCTTGPGSTHPCAKPLVFPSIYGPISRLHARTGATARVCLKSSYTNPAPRAHGRDPVRLKFKARDLLVDPIIVGVVHLVSGSDRPAYRWPGEAFTPMQPTACVTVTDTLRTVPDSVAHSWRTRA